MAEEEPRAQILQIWLARADEVPSRRSRCGDLSFLVAKLHDLKIKMYQERGHKRPHIHIDYKRAQHVAAYAISPAMQIEGNMNASYDRCICKWVSRNEAALLILWERTQSGNDVELVIASLINDV